MINIQQGTLRTLEHDVVATGPQPVQQTGNIIDQRCNQFPLRQRLVQNLFIVHRISPEIVLQGMIVIRHHFTQAYPEMIRIQQLAQTQTPACGLVFIGRTDTPAGGADRLVATCGFTCLIQRNVIGKYQGTGLADAEPLPGRNARPVQQGKLLQQGGG